MSKIMEKEVDSPPKSTGNTIDCKAAVDSESKNHSSQGKVQFEHEDSLSRYSYFLANLANDELTYVDCPSKVSPLKASDVSKSAKDENAGSFTVEDAYAKQDKSESNVFHKYGYGYDFDTDDDDDDDDEFVFILGNHDTNENC